MHHTFFDISLVKLLMEMIEQHHISSNKPFWKIYLDEVDINKNGSSKIGAEDDNDEEESKQSKSQSDYSSV